jgi:hypothetical protein
MIIIIIIILLCVFKPSLVQKHTRLQVYKTLVRPALSYGSEAWTIKKQMRKDYRHPR